MSNPKSKYTKPVSTPEVKDDEPVTDKEVKDIESEPEVTKVPAEQTPKVKPEPTEVKPPVEDKKTPPAKPKADKVDVSEKDDNENVKLAKELNLTIRNNPATGKPITPSTPAMRAALARRKNIKVDNSSLQNIEELVTEQYGKTVLDNPSINHIVTTLGLYVKRMSPNSVLNETTGGEIQANLSRAYDLALSLSPELSNAALEIIVSVIKNNLSGAFQQTLAFRFANTMPLNSESALRFQLLTTLFISLASGTKKRDLAKTINIRQLQDYIPDRTAKANISEFIN